MLRSALRHLLPSLLILWGGQLQAQHVESPLVPRGHLFFRTDPSSIQINGILSDSGEDLPLGTRFFVPELESDEVPGLESLTARIAELTGEPESPFRFGGTVGRFSANEQVFPFRLDYGILDRLTVGVTVPLVRKRVSTLVRYRAEGAEIGTNPRQLVGVEVDGFLAGAETALAELMAEVEDSCTLNGESSPGCQSGRALVEDSEGFLLALDEAYMGETFFPLEGSSVGDQVAGRWSTLRSGMGSWGVTPPEALPLATTPVSDATFREMISEVWDVEGFPFETPETFMALGDVEIHLALGLLDLRPEPPLPGLPAPPEGIRLQSAIQGTLRLPTGQPDSLRLIAPTVAPRGAGGVEVRWITDLLFPGGIGLLGIVEGGFHQAQEMTVLAPYASSPFLPLGRSADVEWTPGNHIRVSISPRKYLGNTLSIGGGWHFLKRDADTFTPLTSGGAAIEAPDEGSTTHALAIELRYSAMNRGEVGEPTGRPFELLIRGTRTLSGSGPWAVRESRVDAGLRFPLRR